MPVRQAPGSQRPSQSGSAPAERRTITPAAKNSVPGTITARWPKRSARRPAGPAKTVERSFPAAPAAPPRAGTRSGAPGCSAACPMVAVLPDQRPVPGPPVRLGGLERHGRGLAKRIVQLHHRALRSGHQRLGPRVDLGVLVGEPERRSRQVDEASLIGDHLGGGSPARVGGRRGGHCLLRLPPHFRDAVVRRFHAPSRGHPCGGGIIHAVRLGVAKNTEPDLVKRHQRAVFVTPDPVELLERQLGLASEQVHQSDHERHYCRPGGLPS